MNLKQLPASLWPALSVSTNSPQGIITQEQNIFWPHIQEGENEQKLTSRPPQRPAQASVKKSETTEEATSSLSQLVICGLKEQAGRECPCCLLPRDFKFCICRQKQTARLSHPYYLQYPLKTQDLCKVLYIHLGRKKKKGAFLVPSFLLLS